MPCVCVCVVVVVVVVVVGVGEGGHQSNQIKDIFRNKNCPMCFIPYSSQVSINHIKVKWILIIYVIISTQLWLISVNKRAPKHLFHVTWHGLSQPWTLSHVWYLKSLASTMLIPSAISISGSFRVLLWDKWSWFWASDSWENWKSGRNLWQNRASCLPSIARTTNLVPSSIVKLGTHQWNLE